MSWTNEDYLTFDKSWNKHNLNVVAGASWYYSKTEKSELGAENFFDDYLSTIIWESVPYVLRLAQTIRIIR